MMAPPPIIIITPPPEDDDFPPPATPHTDVAPAREPPVSGPIDVPIEPLPPACLEESTSIELLPPPPPSNADASPSGDSILVSPLPATPEEKLSALEEETSIDLEETPPTASSTSPLLPSPLPLPPLVAPIPPSPPLSEKIKTSNLAHATGSVKDRAIPPTILGSGSLSAHPPVPTFSA
jgi:hypothetical protein